MQQITVNKDELITILKENRINHQKLYDDAVVGYHEEVIEKLKKHKKFGFDFSLFHFSFK